MLKVLNRILNALSIDQSYKEYLNSFNLKGNEALLEFGCGKGELSKQIAKKLDKGGYLTCSDISDLSLEELKTTLRRYDNINYCFGDIRKMNMDYKIYDKIILNAIIDFIPKSERASYTDFLLLLLKPKGRIFVKQPISTHDGISSTEVRRLMRQAKMIEVNYKFNKVKKNQTIYFGEFKRT